MSAGHSNRLIHSNNPYLLQHAHNPVDWWEWGPEAFAEARRRDVPVFLSIGYATCHWCHVMEQECFEDETVAVLLNRSFVCIKVDREQRPDIDAVYMKACVQMTGSGGWPLNLVLTPDKRPFFAATYIPKTSRYGRMGLVDLIPRIVSVWTHDRDRALSAADQITQALSSDAVGATGDRTEIAPRAYRHLVDLFDEQYGGWGDAPKFPTAHTIQFLLRYARDTGEGHARRMVDTTLQWWQLGGIHDHVGGGFHRYATDRRWILPHFEKMLYDQARIGRALLEWFQFSGDTGALDTVRNILAYVTDRLTAPDGGFYSAEDADSEGLEGSAYLWTHDAFTRAAGTDAGFGRDLFHVQPDGNLPHPVPGHSNGNVLYMTPESRKQAIRESGGPGPFARRLAVLQDRLRTAREKRPRPFLDDKIIACWNGLMIETAAMADRITGDPNHRTLALKAATFLAETMTHNGTLYRVWRKGKLDVPGFLPDYAAAISAMLAVYELTWEPIWIRRAHEYGTRLARQFQDENGRFRMISDMHEKLPADGADTVDGALPAGPALALAGLRRLTRMTQDPQLARAVQLGDDHLTSLAVRNPMGHIAWLSDWMFQQSGGRELVIATRTRNGIPAGVLEPIGHAFLPDLVTILRTPETAQSLDRLVPGSRGIPIPEQGAVFHLCQSFHCTAPTSDPGTVLAALGLSPKGKKP